MAERPIHIALKHPTRGANNKILSELSFRAARMRDHQRAHKGAGALWQKELALYAGLSTDGITAETLALLRLEDMGRVQAALGRLWEAGALWTARAALLATTPLTQGEIEDMRMDDIEALTGPARQGQTGTMPEWER